MEYTLNLGLCFIYGIIFKIYDDIIDNKLNIDTFYLNLTKYFVITLFSIIFYNSIVFSILWFVMAFVSFLMDKYYTNNLYESKDTVSQKDFTCMNDDTWFYSLILSGIFIIYHSIKFFINNQQNDFNLFSYKNITLFINLIINITIVLSDIYFTPEHASDKKLYARIVVLILLSIFFYYMTYFSEYIYEGNYGIILMNIGFLIGSVSFLSLDKFKIFDYLKHKEIKSD
jgi:hypothetical protein